MVETAGKPDTLPRNDGKLIDGVRTYE